MGNAPLTFDQLPAYVYELGRKVDELTDLLQAQQGRDKNTSDRWLTIEELAEYLPGRPAITTLYGKVQRREIPFFREGKRLVFLQSQIDSWLKSKSAKTATEIYQLADSQFTNKHQRKGGRRQKV